MTSVQIIAIVAAVLFGIGVVYLYYNEMILTPKRAPLKMSKGIEADTFWAWFLKKDNKKNHKVVEWKTPEICAWTTRGGTLKVVLKEKDVYKYYKLAIQKAKGHWFNNGGRAKRLAGERFVWMLSSKTPAFEHTNREKVLAKANF